MVAAIEVLLALTLAKLFLLGTLSPFRRIIFLFSLCPPIRLKKLRPQEEPSCERTT